MSSNYTTFFTLFVFLLLVGCARPVAKFTLPTEEPTAPAIVQFDNSSEKSETYLWDFGDGNTSTEESPSHNYGTSGNYLIVLKATKGKKTSTEEQRLIVQAPKNCLVELSTSFGNMVIELYNNTPLHRDNFVKLVEEGFYDDLLFHRVISGFMIQGGDPRSKNAKPDEQLGSGGPGYQVDAEIKNFHGNMASSKGLNYPPEVLTAYVEQGGTPQLDNEYTVFGQVIKGMEVIDKIAATKTQRGNRPVEDVRMTFKVIN